RRLGLKSHIEWLAYCTSGKKPQDIPSNADSTYKHRGWVSWGDWLGTGRIAERNRSFRSFKKERAYARGLGLKSQPQWRAYIKSGELPSDIPAAPWQTYKDKGWIGMGDWLGTYRVQHGKEQFLSYEEAKKYVRSLRLKSQSAWRAYSKSGKKPQDIPS